MSTMSSSEIQIDDSFRSLEDGSSVGGSKLSSSAQESAKSSSAPPGVRHSLASGETRAVTWSKLLVLFVLLGVAAAASTIVFRYTTQQEAQDFEVRFTDFSSQIIGVYKVNAEKILDTYENFAIEISTVAISAQSTWPFVTIPAFELQADRARKQTGARAMGLAHLVKPEEVGAWINYTLFNQGWKQESFDYHGLNQTATPVPPFIWSDFRNFGPTNGPNEKYGVFAPSWQGSPIEDSDLITNFDSLRLGIFPTVYDRMIAANAPILSEARNLGDIEPGFGTLPESFILAPIYRDVRKERKATDIVATLSSILPWDNYFLDLLPVGIDGIILVISNTCNQTFSYEINGPSVTYLGVGDWHDSQYDEYAVESQISPFSSDMACLHTLSLYPSEKFESAYETNKPFVYTIGVICVFLVTVGVFALYDCLVERRQEKVMSSAERSSAIVTSLFPQKVAEKLMKQEEDKEAAKKKKSVKPVMLGQAPVIVGASVLRKQMLGLSGDVESGSMVTTGATDELSSKPIAELFPSATVLFADIVGFTAWSSSREPSHVFELLEEIYSSFDVIAKRKKVFKVETIGDCYMAATGLPEKRKDHAILMARFARDSLRKMLHVVQKLEARLGPDTADLGMRIGIHSGPVTAGVLRGEKARFQLFGDTVNTAARMESTGTKNKIHLSMETAELIRAAGHEDIWTLPRKKQIEAKGKGKMNTHWLAYTTKGGKSSSSAGTSFKFDVTNPTNPSDSIDDDEVPATTEILEDSKQEKLDRWIDWGVENLLRLLKRVIAMRGGIDESMDPRPMPILTGGTDTSVLDEVKDIIELPSQERDYPMSPSKVELPPEVYFQLRDFVKTIALMHKDNPFHSFEHATHVTQSVTKLLTRIVAADHNELKDAKSHQYSYGITSDPLAQFAVVFSALIHDVDHPGVPNATLVQEQTPNAVRYKNKSVAEQNSVDVAWKLLSDSYYADLRSCIFTNNTEFQRFRQLVVNTVMATDIVDKELGAARKKRWEAAFKEMSTHGSSHDEPEAMLDANRKATIVIEHLIQASDVAHTMQHWHVYLKWNQRFFNECYKVYLDGRTDKDPSKEWYTGELGFFDFYIIPLAKKLKECQVFGVASDEYLQYAEANRSEWEAKGKGIVKTYLENYQRNAEGMENSSS